MKEIRTDIHFLNETTKDLKSNIISNGEQVNHVKDVVAKKANFTDLVHYFDKKANKTDFKEIKEALSSPKTNRDEML